MTPSESPLASERYRANEGTQVYNSTFLTAAEPPTRTDQENSNLVSPEEIYRRLRQSFHFKGSHSDDSAGVMPRDYIRLEPGTVLGANQRHTWRDASDGLTRIEMHPSILNGAPTIAGTRISVAQALDVLADYHTFPETLAEFEGQLEAADLQEALIFAARLAR